MKSMMDMKAAASQVAKCVGIRVNMTVKKRKCRRQSQALADGFLPSQSTKALRRMSPALCLPSCDDNVAVVDADGDVPVDLSSNPHPVIGLAEPHPPIFSHFHSFQFDQLTTGHFYSIP